jgi:hypothetical protein
MKKSEKIQLELNFEAESNNSFDNETFSSSEKGNATKACEDTENVDYSLTLRDI